MVVLGMWYVDKWPDHYIIDVPKDGLKMVRIVPFRTITENDTLLYEGDHPRKLRGTPMPDHIYRFYGMEKSGETASEVLHIRLTPMEKDEITRRAKDENQTVANYVRGKMFA